MVPNAENKFFIYIFSSMMMAVNHKKSSDYKKDYMWVM